MISSGAFLFAMAVSNYCEEPVKPAEVEYFKGNVADRFPPGHLFDNMYRPGNSPTIDLASSGRLEFDAAVRESRTLLNRDKRDFQMGQTREALSAITGVPLPHSEVKKLELLRKKLFVASVKDGQFQSTEKVGEEPKSVLPSTDDDSPKTMREFHERVHKSLENWPKQAELIKALRANQAANKSTGLDDSTLRRLEREDDERMKRFRALRDEHARERKELEALKKD